MIKVRELADGSMRYDVRIRGSNGRVVSRTFKMRRDAQRWQRDQLAARDDGSWVDQRLGRQLAGDWFNEWWPTRTDLRPSTRARDESHFRAHVLPQFGELQLGVVDYRLITTWVADLRAAGLAPATVRRCHLLLSKLLSAAVRARRIARNPCVDTDNLPTVERSEMRVITPSQIHLLAAAMQDITVGRLSRLGGGGRLDPTTIGNIADRFAALVLIGGYGGLRFGELAGLRRSRLDSDRRMIHVDWNLVEVRGHLVAGPPKTAAGHRSVPIPRSVFNRVITAADSRVGDDFIFSGADGGSIRAGSFRSRYWKPATEQAGLAGLRMHDLRHTAVSLWIAHGATPKQVQVWAGHRSVATVFDRYGHLFPGGEESVMDSLDAAGPQLSGPGRRDAAGPELGVPDGSE